MNKSKKATANDGATHTSNATSGDNVKRTKRDKSRKTETKKQRKKRKKRERKRAEADAAKVNTPAAEIVTHATPDAPATSPSALRSMILDMTNTRRVPIDTRGSDTRDAVILSTHSNINAVASRHIPKLTYENEKGKTVKLGADKANVVAMECFIKCVNDSGSGIRRDSVGALYVYDGIRWVLDDAHDTGGTVLSRLLGQVTARWVECDPNVDVLKSSRNINVILSSLSRRLFPLLPTDKRDKVNVINGTLDVFLNKDTNKLEFEKRDHERGDALRHLVHTKYDATATAPRFEKWLSEALPHEDARRSLQAFLGAQLAPAIAPRAQLAAFLLGGKRTGKTMLGLLIRDIFGADECSHVTLDELTSDKHSAAALAGKTWNIGDELSGRTIDTTKFKKLVAASGEKTSLRGLGRIVHQASVPYFIFSTNYVAHGLDDAGWDRVIVYPFNVGVREEDKIYDFHKVLVREEGSGILNWLLEGLCLARRMKGDYQCATTIKARDLARNETNSALAYMLEKWVKVDAVAQNERTEDITQKVLYVNYKAYMDATGGKAMSLIRFNRTLRDGGYIVKSGTVRGTNGVKYWNIEEKTVESEPLDIVGRLAGATASLGADKSDSLTATAPARA